MSDAKPHYYLECKDKSSCTDTNNENLRCATSARIISTAYTGTLAETYRKAGIRSFKIKDRLNTCFGTQNKVLVAIDTLQYKRTDASTWTIMAPETGPYSNSEAYYASRAMYNMTFFKPPHDTKAWMSSYTPTSGTAQTYTSTSTTAPSEIKYTESAKYSTSGIHHYMSSNLVYYRHAYRSTASGTSFGNWVAANSNTGSVTNNNSTVTISNAFTVGSATSNHFSPSNNSDYIEMKFITSQPYSMAMAGGEFTYVSDTVSKTLYFTHDFVINAPNITSGGSYNIIGTGTTFPGMSTDLPTSAKTSQTSRLGYTAKVKALPSTGYNFDGWYDRKGNLVSSNAILDITFIRDTLLTPKFSEKPTNLTSSLLLRSGSSETIASQYANGTTKAFSDFVIGKDKISLGNQVTFVGKGKLRLNYCTLDNISSCLNSLAGTRTYIKQIGSLIDLGSTTVQTSPSITATISSEGKIKLSNGTTETQLPITQSNAYIITTLLRYNTSGTLVDSVNTMLYLRWKYPVEFKDVNGTLLSSSTAYATYNGTVYSLPSRTTAGVSSDANGYVFDYYWLEADGSTKVLSSETSISNVKKGLVFTAMQTTKYNVTFYDYDGSVVKSTQAYLSTETVTVPTNPTHKGNTSDYQFYGWGTSANATSKVTISKVSKPTDYYAIYKNRVTFTGSSTTYMLTGAKATAPTVTQKDGYQFIGWYVKGDETQTIVTDFTVTGPVTYEQKFVKIPEIKFTVTGYTTGYPVEDLTVTAPTDCFIAKLRDFKDKEIFSDNSYITVAYAIDRTGECAADELVKEIDEASQYSSIKIFPTIYITDLKTTFNSVVDINDPEIGNIIKQFQIHVVTKPAPAYLITFVDTDKKTTLQSTYVAKDQMPVAPTSYTIPENTAQYTYSFAGWDPTIEAATAEKTYYALLKEETRKYEVRFFDTDDKQIGEAQSIEYGSKATVPSVIPTKEGYYFSAWYDFNTRKIPSQPITEASNFKPFFKEIPYTNFTATGMTEGNNSLTVSTPDFIPSECVTTDKALITDKDGKYVIANPMVAGEKYTWTAEVSISLSETCIQKSNDQVKFNNLIMTIINQRAAEPLPVYMNDVVINENIAHGYSETVTFNVAYEFTAASKPYIVRFFKDVDQQIGSDQEVESGKAATAPAAPTKDEYVFVGWDRTFSSVNSNLDVYAQWAQVPNINIVVTDLTEGKVVPTTEFPDFFPEGCATWKKNEVYDEDDVLVTEENPMEAGKTYKWKAWVYLNVTCESTDKRYNDLKAIVTMYYNKKDVAIPMYINDEKIIDNLITSNGYFVYEFTAEAVSNSSSSSEEVKKEDSSSSKKSSSSTAKGDEESSSSSKKKSSSSSADDEDDEDEENEDEDTPSSSSKKTTAIAAFDAPTFGTAVSGRNLSVFGASVGSKMAIFDLQGSVIYSSRVGSANFTVAMPRSGSYVIRIDNQVKKINVR